ncbi:hypothetical protein [Membranihabitans marinus]|uniref:hypothetical protein n=1 Tax=Membranihabitans marinus TaxID=1227546 RepID=UPI001F2F5F77|nr:hypothetical protein [Membranihabitans marinus]
MSKKYSYILVVIVLIGLCLLPSTEVLAQCPMCKMSAESNLSNGGSAGQGLNKGILFLLSLPYLLIGTLGYVWWKNKNKTVADFSEEG